MTLTDNLRPRGERKTQRVLPALSALLLTLANLVTLNISTVAAQTAAPPLPAGWPATLEIGIASPPGGAAAMRTDVPYAFRYQYLAGGVNTGSGWATWNTDGDFARLYIEDSVQNGVVPVFTYYQIY